MENQNKILIAIGAIAAAYLGKKQLDKRRGSGAIWSLPVDGRKISQQDAFAAFSQRKAGLIPWENEADKSLNRMQFMKKYAADGYDTTRFGATSDNQTIWNQWLGENRENYGYIEKIMGSTIEGRFDDGNDTSSVFDGNLKSGYSPLSPQGTFDGTTGPSDGVMSGEGTLKHNPMSPQGKYSGSRREYDPFSPLRVPRF
jgi:hypothetical protein